MAGKNGQKFNDAAGDDILNFFYDQMTPEILVELLKHKIDAGQANVGDVIKNLVNNEEMAVVVMKKVNYQSL